MEALRLREIAVLGDAVLAIGAAGDLATLRSSIPARVRQLVDCDVASYNEVGPPQLGVRRREVYVEADPPDMLSDGQIVESFAAHVHQNPLLAHFQRTGDSATLRMSDHISRRALHRLELYDEVYRRLGIEHQLAVTMPLGGAIVGITASRGGRDFDEHERRLLSALGPFIAAALANLRDRARLDAMLAALEHARGPVATVLLVEHGRVCAAEERGERWLAALTRSEPESLQRLTRWATRPAARGAVVGAGHAGHACARLSLGGTVARYFAPTGAGPAAVMLESSPTSAADELGLTRRQAEILELVAAGASNDDVAVALAISPRTVAHHLEHTYRRLGVSTRTAAARRLSELSRGS